MDSVRIRGGKAVITREWCIDCGECLKACRGLDADAIFVEQDDFQRIFEFENRVVLMPAVFLAQFPETTSEEQIFGALKHLGFTHIYPVEMSVDLVRREIAEAIRNVPQKPAISPYCPAVVKLIQVKYPDLVDNILTVRPPVEVTAMLLRRQFEKQGLKRSETGIFYVTPCAAKIAAIKGIIDTASLFDGTLNMDLLYNKVSVLLKNTPKSELERDGHSPVTLTGTEMWWSQTDGEADNFEGRSFAVDDIDNVTEFLDRMELSEEGMKSIDFLELRACNRGCMGGVLTPANRFLATESLRERAKKHPTETELYKCIDGDVIDKVRGDMHFAAVKPMPKLVLNGTRGEVLKKMHSVEQILSLLPKIDCCACGSPGCKSLAEDIMRGEAQLTNCIFMQREMEKSGEIDSSSSLRFVEEIWGEIRFTKSTNNKEE